MSRWAVLIWRVNNALGNRYWHLLPYRLRHRWAVEHQRAGFPTSWRH